MIRVVIAVLLLLLATACGAPVFPSGGAVRPTSGESVALTIAVLVAALVAFLLSRAAGNGRNADQTPDRALRVVLVFCVAFAGVLLAVTGWFDQGRLTHGIISTVAATAWGAVLLLQFRAVRRTSRLSTLARVGSLFVVASIPIFLFAIWIDGDQRNWRGADTSLLLATVIAHWTFMAGLPLRSRQRWLVVVTLAGSGCLAVAATLAGWGALDHSHFAVYYQILLPLTIAGTILVILCRRRDARTDATVTSKPDRPPT